jgi:cysteine-rich repeat protein
VGVDPYARGRFIGPLPVCGDGTVTFPEECDDGNTTGGDCCSPTCTYEAADTPCPDDGSLCTDDMCDGAGVCQHPAITCDDGDPCTADSCNPATGCVFADPPAAAKPKVVMAKLGEPAGDDKLFFKGEVILVHPFAPPLDPVSNGARVVLTDSEGGSILDVTLPGGLYDAVLRVGWTVKGNGTKWTYDNKSPAPPGGIVKIKVQDRSATTPGLVKFGVKGKYGTYSLLPANLPVTALLALAPPAATTPQCAQASFPGPPPAPSCAMHNPTLRCK